MTTHTTQPRESVHVFASSLRFPDRTAEAITGVSHLSWSRISCYQLCPRQFATRYIEHLPPDFRSSSMLFGSGIHAGVELHHLARLEGMQVRPEEMLIAFDQEWSADRNRDVPVRYPKGDDEDKLRKLAGKAFGQFLASPLATPAGEIIAIEETVIGVIDVELPTIVARVDLVTVEDDVVRLGVIRRAKDLISQASRAASPRSGPSCHSRPPNVLSPASPAWFGIDLDRDSPEEWPLMLPRCWRHLYALCSGGSLRNPLFPGTLLRHGDAP